MCSIEHTIFASGKRNLKNNSRGQTQKKPCWRERASTLFNSTAFHALNPRGFPVGWIMHFHLTCMKNSIILLCLFFSSLAQADDITTTGGKVYKGISISRIEPDGLVCTTDDGIEKILFVDMSAELQAKYKFDPAKAEKFRDSVASAAAANAQKAARAEQQLSIAKAQGQMLADQPAATPKRLRGTVKQSTPEGLIIECEAPRVMRPVASASASVGGGGGAYIAVPAWVDPKRPESAFGTFLITGHPKQAGLADAELIDVDAIENGLYSYETVTGANKRIKKFTVTKTVK